jgi:DNA ligase (NAD+)
VPQAVLNTLRTEEHMLIDDLNARLQAARKAYYAGNEPLMSDGDYDSLEAQIAGMAKAHKEQAAAATVLTTVGSDTSGRIVHIVPMLSLENKYSFEELLSWAEALGWPTLSLGSKWDGVSGSLIYDRGVLVQALTRGDGAAGESILRQILACSAIPSTLPVPISLEIRVELLIKQSTLAALNAELEARGLKPYASTRNLVAGSLKLLDPREVAHRQIMCRPWEVLFHTPGEGADSSVQRLHDIVTFGFPPPDDCLIRNREELRAALEKKIEELQEPDQEIGRDGLVLKVDDPSLRERLGRGAKYTFFQVCYKMQNQRALSTIRSIEWQVGRQGKLTPVATVDPVVLGGVTIERVTLNNLDWLLALGVRIGIRVWLVRSGDVIPKATEVVADEAAQTFEVVAPTHCPECNSLIVVNTEESAVTTHMCVNPKCPGRLRDLLTYIADRTVLDIEGLGDDLAAKLVENDFVTSLADLFEFGNEAMATVKAHGEHALTQTLAERGFPAILTLRMIQSLEKAKKASWPRVLAAFGIPAL